MLRGVSWLLLGQEGIYFRWFWQAQGPGALCAASHYWPLPKRRIHELAAWHPPAWLLGFLRSEAEGCCKRSSTGKRFSEENDPGAVWNVPERALGNLYAGFCSKLERRGEHPGDLCSFLSGVLTSLRISFTIYKIEIIVPASRGVWRWKWAQLDYGLGLQAGPPKNYSAGNLRAIRAQALAIRQ